MTPQRFKEANCVMASPPGMDNCCDVHAFRNGEVVISCWRPTPEELVKINLGEPVWLSVVGERMPPIAVTADYPFQE